jgi:hypothetical protein
LLAITSPETYGFADKKVPPAGRRGLVLIGKLLTALSNDVEFGNKEAHLVKLNPFLRSHRDGIKEFLKSISTMRVILWESNI